MGPINGGDTVVRNHPYITPFNIFPLNSNSLLTSVTTGALSGSASISGGPTFTVPVLDTQEFYQGILNPIPLQVVDFYLQQGFPPELVYDLIISKIVVTRIDNGSCRQFTFTNSVDNDLQFGQFQAMADYLIASGFSAERVNRATNFGPSIAHTTTDASAGDAARVVDAYAHAAQAGLDVKSESSGGETKYVLQKKSSEIRACFAYKGGPFPDWLKAKDKSIFCGLFGKGETNGAVGGGQTCMPRGADKKSAGKTEDAANFTGQQGIIANGQSELKGIALAPALLNRIGEFQHEQWDASNGSIAESDLFPVRDFAGGHVSLKFTTRSTEGILYYLGEIARRNLSPDHGAPAKTIQTKVGLRYAIFPRSDCDGSLEDNPNVIALDHRRDQSPNSAPPFHCENIFVIDAGPKTGNTVASAFYDGTFYSIPQDKDHGGRSAQVLELAKQILNLNTSAKQLPSTTVISVVGAQ